MIKKFINNIDNNINDNINDNIDNNTIITNERKLYENIGFNFTITDTLLGNGSYGDVYLALDENNNKYAIKCCDIEKNGIPNILETSIMSSIIHPYINRSYRILASDKKLYIIQDLAKTDLAHYTRRDKNNYKPNINELRKWCFSLVCAIDTLHKNNIIHADIKASNVLLYNDDNVRLTDFTLSTKKWNLNSKYNNNVCTCTHRPLECLLRKYWDESLDIWSLGCTFYEIAYGELLFPYQGSLDNKNDDEKTKKLLLKQRSINCIIDWSVRGPNPPTSYEDIGIKQFNVDYIHFNLCNDFYNKDNSLFNDLLCKMLIVEPNKRLSIKNILYHPFFKNLTAPLYLNIKKPLNKISFNEQARVCRYIERYSSNELVQSLALSIYCKCNDLNITEHIKSSVCTWISSKIILGVPASISLPPHEILLIERQICHNINFRIHNI
jgi:serine/threonine protein kinase